MLVYHGTSCSGQASNHASDQGCVCDSLFRVKDWRPGDITVASLAGKFQKTFGSSGPEHFIADRGHPIQIVICLLKSQDLDTEMSSQHFTECPQVLRVTVREISF